MDKELNNLIDKINEVLIAGDNLMKELELVNPETYRELTKDIDIPKGVQFVYHGEE